MYVFVVMATRLSEHTLLTQVHGVYAHMHQAVLLTSELRAMQGVVASITKHEVAGLAPTLTLGQAKPAFPAVPVGGVQPVSAARLDTGALSALLAQAFERIGQHDLVRPCDTPEMAEALGYLAQAREMLLDAEPARA